MDFSITNYMKTQVTNNQGQWPRVKVFSSSAAMEFLINLNDAEGEGNKEKSFISMVVANADGAGGYHWDTAEAIRLKLSQTEVMSLTSVFLRIKVEHKIEKRKTAHHSSPAYKNIRISPNPLESGLLLNAGIVFTEKTPVSKNISYRLPVTEMDCVRVGLFLLGYLTEVTPMVSSDAIITALRLSETRSSKLRPD
ncbi:Uncharacterised protein [Enterobacter hormaechei]|nr:Uncharacterised protein [Enterobacter hormaechei]VAE26912.1 Uncharacterised protein [Enterobacter hormaechei]